MPFRLTLTLAGLLASVAFPALAENLRIGWQQIVEPSRVAQADGAYEKATGAEITWNLFGGGADVIAAIASGAIDIGYVGSSPLTAAASQGLPIEAIYIVGNIAEAEALATKGITTPADLKGKKIATPFVSTAHYSLLTALKHWGIQPTEVSLLNLRPQEIAAAWERGDIDGAYIWDPVLNRIKSTGGTVIADSADVADWGGPTFDAWIVRKDYAEQHPEIVTAFVKTTGDATDSYLKDPSAWGADSQAAEKIAKLTGAPAADVPALLKGYAFAGLKDQVSPAFLGGATAEALKATAGFLQEQGSARALEDYSPYVNASFAETAGK
ncbi:taurine ABC transporter substrate-binding protein [Haematobacter massiliensis]|uniref:Taurine ABC transporter substrate-binding protein n=1 Tax=Haematobacter massiliensis TaxID=195105 RepID=A0A086Y6W4_9RHOB|nr:taurine ABC transporter substrate-binding protein [Haematobacter massiliensis]KFI30014.1 taurine ABC transporter substrate-binding protein [Haematobacter massiliensis]OWJ69392.1 taurine ABC transporter substrate-binding protein [Haematobacter massiliensis]OWJ86951.1 taurine ABC transporter substrate-binding protein [Haematobacter massiliensis]QBJ25521.1 taurine ABC transporter substrate-binding protein [Haematobacter massiliensis]